MKKTIRISLVFLIFILVGCNNSISDNNKMNKVNKGEEFTQDIMINYLRQTLFINKYYKNIIDSFYLYGMDSKNVYIFYQYALLNKHNKIIEERHFPVVIKLNNNQEITTQISPKNDEDLKTFLRWNFPEELIKDAEDIKDELSVTQTHIDESIKLQSW